MKQLVTVRMGSFAAEALAGRANGKPSAEDILRAINFYLNDKGAREAGWSYPGFLQKRKPGREVEFELGIGSPLWHLLEREAEDQGVTVEQLLDHAVLYYAAELDAGHVAERMLGDVGKD